MIVRAPRRRVNIPARMRAGGPPVSVCVRDISARSMLVEAAAPPLSGTFVEIIGAQTAIAGQVIWSRPNRFAVRTRERLDVQAAAAELRSLSMTGEDCACGPKPKAATFGRAPAADHQHQAERSRMLGRRIQFLGLAAGVAVTAASVAGLAYYTMSHSLASVGAGLRSSGQPR
jgi:hypothetical protein